MPDIYLSAFYLLLTMALSGSTMILILQLRKLRYKKIKQLPRVIQLVRGRAETEPQDD